MCASYPSPGDDKVTRWELSSGDSSPRSDTSTNTNTLFSSPGSPADTELSFPSVGPKDAKISSNPGQIDISIMPSIANHILVGQTAFTPGHIRGMADELLQSRKTGEFPNTTSAVEDPQTIVEDYQLLQRLRDIRGDLMQPPPEKYTVLKVDIARRIKARDEAHGGSSNLEEMDHRVQNWMNSINKEARMLEITQAALQRKGINNPTQDDLDAIAEEFMQIAERTLLDVANPLRMNATRMEGNISRFDSQLNGFDGAMAAQLNGLASLNDAVNTSMTSQISTLNTMLSSQSNSFTGSVNMLNTALGTVTTDLHQLTSALPALIVTAVQAAVREQLASASNQHSLDSQHHANLERPPGYATATWSQHQQQSGRGLFAGFAHPTPATAQVLRQQQHEQDAHLSTSPTKSKLKKFFRCIMGKGRSEKKGDHKEARL
ncbi:hypothetical protein CH063_13155, partial [Colletotrichum higginsianum]